MDYKYNCSSLYYLKMESGLIPVPENSKSTYIVVKPEEGDFGIVDNSIYQYTNSEWIDTGEKLEIEDDILHRIN